jgi:Fe-S oxidoreductase
MSAAGTDFHVLGEEEWCCGLPQYKLGFRERARELAKHNVEVIGGKGLELLVVDCPECYRALNEFYPAFGYRLEAQIVHSTEYMIELIKAGRLQLKKDIRKSLTYHDPCELARHSTPNVRTKYETSDLYDPPREILDAIPGIHFEEMRWNRFKTYCCGGNLGVKEIYPDISLKIGEKVTEEALKTGADILAVACPSCKLQFSRVSAGKGNLEIYSIAELVAQSIQ